MDISIETVKFICPEALEALPENEDLINPQLTKFCFTGNIITIIPVSDVTKKHLGFIEMSFCETKNEWHSYYL